MRYVGGKHRICKWVSEAILSVSSRDRRYIEPFVGSVAIFREVAPYFEVASAGDCHPDLMALWRSVARGDCHFPNTIDRNVYDYQRTADVSAFRGLVGFGASFGGKWFGGYADTPFDKFHGRVTKPFYSAALRSIFPLRACLEKADILKTCNYDEWSIDHNCIVYCDPPYRGTLGYAKKFNSDRFWHIADEWVALGACVIVSEQVAPDDWLVLASRCRKSMLRVADTANTWRIEKIFWKPPFFDVARWRWRRLRK